MARNQRTVGYEGWEHLSIDDLASILRPYGPDVDLWRVHAQTLPKHRERVWKLKPDRDPEQGVPEDRLTDGSAPLESGPSAFM